MQAIKEKLNDMSAMRKAKAEAKEEEKAEKELAKARVQVAHEVRMAREAEAAMDLHVNKAAEKVAEHEKKHINPTGSRTGQDYNDESYMPEYSSARTSPINPDATGTYPTTGNPYGTGADGCTGGDPFAYGARDTSGGGAAATAGTGGYTDGANRSGGPTTPNLL